MKKYRMYIGGKWVDAESGKTFKSINPATEEVCGELALGDVADVNKAVKAAQKALPEWSAKPQEERSRIIKEIGENIRKRVKELIDMDIIDHGSPVGLATTFGSMVPELFVEAAELSKNLMSQNQINSAPGLIPYLRREPMGVVACIVPWNVPLMIAIKMADSLVTGNVCIAKPPSCNSIGACQIVEMIAEHPDLPPGVLNLVTGPGNTVGHALAKHPGINMISFTGSSETGKDLLAASSDTVKRMFIELGGKNPFVVLEDADVEQAVNGATESLFFNSGMICGSPGRFYVHEKLHDKFVKGLVDFIKTQVVVGDPHDPKTTMGPVVTAEHRDKVESYFKLGVEEGGTIVIGGKRPTKPPLNKGYYVMPTVFTGLTHNMRISREEIFGPVACVIKYSSSDDVLRMANDTRYGLSASVWTKDINKGIKFASLMQAGNVGINTHNPGGNLPRGGFKESGWGKEAGGTYGLLEYTQLKGICVNLTGGAVKLL
jgi:acyl-CoA reductase-like NAD-dependent aldehyde dehydrogenase